MNGCGFGAARTSSSPCARAAAPSHIDFDTVADTTPYDSVDNLPDTRYPFKFDLRKGQFLEKKSSGSHAAATFSVSVSAEAQPGVPIAEELPNGIEDLPSIRYDLVINLTRTALAVAISGGQNRFTFYEFPAYRRSLYVFTQKIDLPVGDLIRAAVKLVQTTLLARRSAPVHCTSRCPPGAPTSTISCTVDSVRGSCLDKNGPPCSDAAFVLGHCPG